MVIENSVTIFFPAKIKHILFNKRGGDRSSHRLFYFAV